MALKFTCKDPMVTRYYENLFGPLFTAQWAQVSAAGPSEQERVKAGWRDTMIAEARRQEHYDYGIHATTGRRVPILEWGQRRLLVPTVEVVD